MKIIKCDKCGLQVEDPGICDRKNLDFGYIKMENYSSCHLDLYDICPHCMSKLKEWLENKEKESWE